MKCPSSERQLLAFLGRLPDGEARDIARHARTCLPCLRRARVNAQLVDMLEAPPSDPCPASELTRRILQACDDDTSGELSVPRAAERELSSLPRGRGTSALVIAMAAAGVLALLTAGALVEVGAPARVSSGGVWKERVGEGLTASRASRTHDQPADQASGAGVLRVTEELERRAAQHVLLAQYEQAESLYARALGLKEQALGADAPSLTASLDDLAALYLRQHRYVEAEPLFRRSVAIKAKQLGPNHPAVMSALDSLQVLLSLTTQA